VTSDQSALGATLLGVGLTLLTAAAAELGVPRAVWIVAAIAGTVSFVTAFVLYVAGRDGASQGSPGQRWPQSPEIVAAVGLIVLLGGGILIATSVDGSPSRGVAIICIDSSGSTKSVRASYLPDLKQVVLQAASRKQQLYVANCGSNATGQVNWPVHREFGPSRKADPGRILAHREAEEVFSGGIAELVEAGPEARGTSLGEMLAVMARQCGQAGGSCELYLFTDGEWNDSQIRLRDGLSDGELRNYLTTYQMDLAGSQVNFVGVGLGTSIGEVRLGEAREIASQLVERAGGEMGAWTTRL
jgi:hypothetical protein